MKSPNESIGNVDTGLLLRDFQIDKVSEITVPNSIKKIKALLMH